MGTHLKSDKASIFRDEAIDAGWDAEVSRDGSLATVTATRESDGAVLSIVWDDDKCLNEVRLTVNGYTRKVRNAGAARRELVGEFQKFKKLKQQAKPPTQKLKSIPVEEESPEILPELPTPGWGAEHEIEPDAIVLAAVVGKKISWYNPKTRIMQTAIVPDKPRLLWIQISPITLRRVLNFAAAGEGFRSVYIDQIVSASK